MKDSQRCGAGADHLNKYIKANNERFSTCRARRQAMTVSISRRIMKDSQPPRTHDQAADKYIKANNERFSTHTNPHAHQA